MPRRDPSETRRSEPKPGKCKVCHGHQLIMDESQGVMITCPSCRGSGVE